MIIKRWLLSVFYFFCCISIVAQTIENPVFDRTDQPSFHIDKIEMTQDTTFVYFTFSAEANSWANISPNMYLEDVVSGKKHTILKSDGLPFAPQERTFYEAERCIVKLSFPSSQYKGKINIIETPNEKAFNIYGIDLSKQYDCHFMESELNRFKNMSSFYDSANDTLKALQYKEKEVEATKYIYGIKSEPLILAYTFSSIMYDKYGKYDKAIKTAIEEGEISGKLWGTLNSDYALHLRTLAQFYSHAIDYKKAIETYKKSIDLYETLGIVDDQYALALQFIAYDYRQIEESDSALIYEKKCLKTRRKIGDANAYISELLNILIEGNSNYDFIKCIDLVEEEIHNLPAFVDNTSISFAIIPKQTSAVYSLIGNNQKAIWYCDKALTIYKNNSLDNSIEYAELLGLKCRYQRRCELYDEAVISGEKAKLIYDTLGLKSTKYAELLEDLAWIYGQKYNFERSIKMQQTAVAIYEEAKDWISLAGVYNNISHYFHCILDFENAEHYIKKAIEVLEEHDDANQYIKEEIKRTGNDLLDDGFGLLSIKRTILYKKSSFLGTLAQIYYKKGNMVDAISTERKCGFIVKELGDNEMYSSYLITLSEYLRRNKQYEDAKKAIEQCLEIISTIGNNNRINPIYPKLELAAICFDTGDTTKAIHYAKEAVSLSKALSNNNLITTAQSILSSLYWKNQEYEKAESVLSNTLDYLRSEVLNEIVGMTSKQKQRLWSQYEHMFLQYRNIIEKLDKKEGLLSKLYDYVLFSKSLLLDTEIISNREEKSRLSITWRDIQKKLSNQDIAIEFISTTEEKEGYNTYHALIIDKDCNSPKMITLISETALEKKKETDSRHVQDIVGELLWKPIIDRYSEVKNIYFSPDGILHILPIEYYKVDSIRTMFDSFNMFRLSSTKELVDRFNKQEPNIAALYGGLDYSPFTNESTIKYSTMHYDIMRGISKRGGFEPLFNTYEEVQEINNQLKRKNISTTVYSSIDGTETSFKNLSNKAVNIIHLATHGMYVAPSNLKEKKQINNFQFLELLSNEKDPVKEDIELTHSFLVMSGGNSYIQRHSTSVEGDDGILTAKEISLIDLHGLDLVVLSACESARGDIRDDGVYGLQRGFKKAGANTLLMSLDKVDDEATRILMVEFYKNLMSGKTKLQSLKNAQKHLRQVENGKYDDPKYWASFIMLDGLN